MKTRHQSRRAFLAGLGTVALRGATRTDPELILYNANILTVDANEPRAQAVAIAGGRFLAVGSNEDIRSTSKPGTRQLNLGGKTIVPGFIDAHTHPSYAGIRHLRWVDCDLRSIAAIQDAIRKRAAKTPPGDWVIGFKYDECAACYRRSAASDHSCRADGERSASGDTSGTQ